jgi:UBA/TS-N domain
MNANNNNRGQPQPQHHQQQYSFFVGAPFSKLVIVATLVLYLTAIARGGGGGELNSIMMRMNAARIRERGEVYRYASSKVTFLTNGEFFVGMTLLLFLLRKFEREMGSRKMMLFCIFILMGTMAVEAVFIVHSTTALLTTSSSSFHNTYQYSGPYPLIGALFSLFHQYTPRLYPRFFSILGVAFSEKFFYYLWFLAMAGGAGWNSALAVTIGWMVAWLYHRIDVVKNVWDIPEPLAAILSDIGSRISEAPPHILVTAAARGVGAPGGAGAAAGGARRPAPRPPGGGAQHPTAAALAAAAAAAGGIPPLVGGGPNIRPAAAAAAQRPTVADPAAIEQLVMMGFSRPQVVEALQWSNNDVQRAADRLLTQS